MQLKSNQYSNEKQNLHFKPQYIEHKWRIDKVILILYWKMRKMFQ